MGDADQIEKLIECLKITSGVTISETVKFDGAIYYVISIMTRKGHMWEVKHRFSDFDELADDLCQEIGLSHRAELPGKLPRKSLFHGEKIVEKRKKKLAKFLDALIRDPVCLETNVIKNFLCSNAEIKNEPSGEVKTQDDNTFHSTDTLYKSKANVFDNAGLDDDSGPPKHVSKKPPRPGPPGGKKSGRIPPPNRKGGRIPPPSSSAGGRIPPPSSAGGRKPPPLKKAPPPSASAGRAGPPPNPQKSAPPPAPSSSTPVPQKKVGVKTFSATPNVGRKPPIPIVKGKKIRKPTNVGANSGSSRDLEVAAPPPVPIQKSEEPSASNMDKFNTDKRQSGRKAFPGSAMPDLSKVKLRTTKGGTKGGFALGSKKATQKKEEEDESGMTELQKKMAARRKKVDDSTSKKTNKRFSLGIKQNEPPAKLLAASNQNSSAKSKPPPKPFQGNKNAPPSWKKKDPSEPKKNPPWVKKDPASPTSPPWMKKKKAEPVKHPSPPKPKHPVPPKPNLPPVKKPPPAGKKVRKDTEPDTPPAPYSAGMVGGMPPQAKAPTPQKTRPKGPPPNSKMKSFPPVKGRPKGPPPKSKAPPPVKTKSPPPQPVTSPKRHTVGPPSRGSPQRPPPKRNTMTPIRSAPPAAPNAAKPKKPGPPSKFKGRPAPPSSSAPRGPNGRPMPPSSFNKTRTAPSRPPPPKKNR